MSKISEWLGIGFRLLIGIVAGGFAAVPFVVGFVVRFIIMAYATGQQYAEKLFYDGGE